MYSLNICSDPSNVIIEHLWQKSVWKQDILQFTDRTSVSFTISELKKENLTRNLIIINHPRQHFLRCEVFKTKRFSFWLISTTCTPILDDNINQVIYLSGSNYSYMIATMHNSVNITFCNTLFIFREKHY